MRKCIFAAIFLLACAHVRGYRSKQLEWIEKRADCNLCTSEDSWSPECPSDCGDKRKRKEQLPLFVEEAEREFENYLLRRKKVEDFLRQLMEYYY